MTNPCCPVEASVVNKTMGAILYQVAFNYVTILFMILDLRFFHFCLLPFIHQSSIVNRTS